MENASSALIEVHEREKLRLIGSLMALRAAIVPIPLVLTVWLLVYDHTLWRRAVMSISICTMMAVAIGELVQFRRRGGRGEFRTLNVKVGMLMQSMIIFVTGGAESPILPTALIATLIVAMFGSRSSRIAMWVVTVGTLWLGTIVELRGLITNFNPTVFGGGVRSGHSDAQVIFSTVVMTVWLSIAIIAGRKLRESYDRLMAGLVHAREDALNTHAEKAQLFETLSGEIAHELKNPLASVKGLSALIAKDLSGKSAERMSVMRREVDRMHEILDGFLNFSRPLGALAGEEIDLGALASQVAALHEGMAAEKRVKLRVDGAARAHCDRRKVQQVLINLVQNAIEASALDGEIAIEVRQNAASGVEVAVLDRGCGLTVERAFEPGVTSKPKGSGLGLTIARALARQHGGDVRLTARAGGGVEAVLALPMEKAA